MWKLIRGEPVLFQEDFVEWLRGQPGADLERRTFDASHLYATAFEFTAIGAWRMEAETIG
jgi:hypothetical protein